MSESAAVLPSASGVPLTASQQLSWREVLASPLPELSLLDRALLRTAGAISMPYVGNVIGIENVDATRDPFILAVNHTCSKEAIILPALLFLHRNGRLVHFLADWNFRLFPPLDLFYRRAGVITVMQKSARPRLLNALKPLYRGVQPPFNEAADALRSGRSIGIFAEGTINRDSSLTVSVGVKHAPSATRDHLANDRARSQHAAKEPSRPVRLPWIPGIEPEDTP